MILNRTHLAGLMILVVISSGCIENFESVTGPEPASSPPFVTVSSSNLSAEGPVATITVPDRTAEVASLLQESSLFDRVKRTGETEIQATLASNATSGISNITNLIEQRQGFGAYVPLTNGTGFETNDRTVDVTIYPDTVVIDGEQYGIDEGIDVERIIMDRHGEQPWPYYRVWDHSDVEAIEEGSITSPSSFAGVKWQAQLIVTDEAASHQQHIFEHNYEQGNEQLLLADEPVELVYRSRSKVISRLHISSSLSNIVTTDMSIQGSEDTAAEAQREYSLLEASILFADVPDGTEVDIEDE